MRTISSGSTRQESSFPRYSHAMKHLLTPCCRLAILISIISCAHAAERVDLLITNGVIFDGSGSAPVNGSIAVRDGHVLAVGDRANYVADRTVDAHGLAVSPGFINMLS